MISKMEEIMEERGEFPGVCERLWREGMFGLWALGEVGARLCHCCCHRWVTLVVEPSSAALYSSQQLQIQSAFPELLLMQSVCGRAGRAGHPPCLVQLGFC